MKNFNAIYILHFIVISIFATLCFYVMHNSSNAWKVNSIEITVPSTGTIELGHALLGQKQNYRSAEERHIAFRQNKQSIEFANIASYKKIDAKTDRFDTLFVQRFPLHEGDKILINNVMIDVVSVSNTSLTLRNHATNDSIEWHHDHLVYNGEDLERSPWKGEVRRFLGQYIPFANVLYAKKSSETRIFTLGGTVPLYKQWAIEGLQPNSAAITWLNNTFYLAPAKEHRILFMPHDQEKFISFNDAWLPLQGEMGTVKRLIIGSTYYKVQQQDNIVYLYPDSRQDIFVEHPVYSQNDAVRIMYEKGSWIGAGKDIQTWFAADVDLTKFLFAIGLGIAVTVAIWMYVYKYTRTSSLSILVLAILVPCSFVLYIFGGALNFTYSVLLYFIVYTWATYTLWSNGKNSGATMCLWLCCIFFCSTGLVTLLQLSAGSENTRWQIYVHKQLWVSICLAYVVALISYLPTKHCAALRSYLGRDRPSNFLSRWGMCILFITVTIFMVVYAFWGSETGMAGFQPSEFLKFLFVLVSSVAALSLRYINENIYKKPYSRQQLLYAFLYVLFLGLLALIANMNSLEFVQDIIPILIVAPCIFYLARQSHFMFIYILLAFLIAMGSLAVVRDISPVFILMTFAVYWIWSVSSPKGINSNQGRMMRWSQSPLCMTTRTLVVLFLVSSVAFFTLVYMYPECFKTFLPQFERFAVWTNPLAYPHSGAQVLGSLKMVFAGGWTGADSSCFGSNGMAMALPAVQDDFILAFFIYKFGALSSILLLCFQVFYIGLLWSIGNQARNIQESYDERDSAYILSYILHGLAVIHALQWTISWGNTLGLLPVMGQPMTWLSAGNSHFIAIACTSLALALFTTWSLPEK